MQKTYIDRISGGGGYHLQGIASISDLDLRLKEKAKV